MSKQEKLAAFLRQADKYLRNNVFADPEQVCSTYCDYLAAPDDPPPRPEMPECVAKIGMHIAGKIKGGGECGPDTAELLHAVWNYYRQPLRLEVGKVYADEKTFLVDVVWHNQMFEDHFVGVRREGGLPYIYSSCGVCMSDGGENLIREVPNG